MFRGWMSFAGAELVNNSRTLAYTKHMMAGLTVLDCDGCDNMNVALGDKAYTSPLVDQPEWFDPNNTDTWNFLGMLLLEAEGVEDGTVDATVTELTGDGAYVSRPRKAAREMRFRAVLLGLDEAAVQSGMVWLRKALDGDWCRSATDGCTGDHLCYFAACPAVCEDSPNIPPDHIRYNLVKDPRGRGNPAGSFTGGGSASWEAGYSEPGDETAVGFVRENLVPDPAATTLAVDGGWSYTGDLRTEQTNLVPNPSFEVGISGWSPPGGTVATITRDTTWFAQGASSLKITPTGTSVDTFAAAGAAVYGALQVGVTYTITATLHLETPQSGTPSGNARTIRVYDASGTLMRSAQAPNVAGDHVVSLTFTPTETVTGLRLYNGAMPADGGDENAVWWDLVTLVEGEQAVQFDGDTEDTSETRYAWTGSPHASTSTATPLDATVLDAVTGGQGPQVTPERMLTTYVRAISAGGSSLAGWSAPVERRNLPMGQEVMASVYVRRTAAGQVSLSVREGELVTTGALVDAPAGAWVRLSVPATIATEEDPLSVVAEFVSIGEGEQVAVTGALVEIGTELGEYFDGDSTGTPGQWSYGWGGEANASTSYQEVVIVDSPQGVGFQWTWATQGADEEVRAASGSDVYQVEPVVAAQQYAARAWVWAPDGAAQVGLRGSWRDAAGVRLPGVADFWYAQTVDPAPGWALYEGVSPAAPVDAAMLVVSPAWSSPIARGTPLAWAALLVEESDQVPVDYFDGDSTDTQMVRYGWRGEPDESVSEATPNVARLCPTGEIPSPVESCVAPYERHLYRVTTTSGPTVLAEYDVSCGAMWEVEWTMTAGVPTPYATPLFVGRTSCTDEPSELITDTDCPADDATTPLQDPNCRLPAPPRPPLVLNDCLVDTDEWRRFQVDVPTETVPMSTVAVPYLTIRSFERAVNQVRIRFFPNPFGFDVTRLDGGCNFCGEFLISYLPPNSTLTIDGMQQRASVVTYDGETAAAYQRQTFSANHLLYGSDGSPMSWPELSCGVGYAMTVDVVPNLVERLEIQACLSIKE